MKIHNSAHFETTKIVENINEFVDHNFIQILLEILMGLRGADPGSF